MTQFLLCYYFCTVFTVSKVTHRDVGSEAGDERGSDGIGDRGVGALGLLSCCSYDVKPDEGIEAGGSSLHHL